MVANYERWFMHKYSKSKVDPKHARFEELSIISFKRFNNVALSLSCDGIYIALQHTKLRESIVRLVCIKICKIEIYLWVGVFRHSHFSLVSLLILRLWKFTVFLFFRFQTQAMKTLASVENTPSAMNNPRRVPQFIKRNDIIGNGKTFHAADIVRLTGENELQSAEILHLKEVMTARGDYVHDEGEELLTRKEKNRNSLVSG